MKREVLFGIAADLGITEVAECLFVAGLEEVALGRDERVVSRVVRHRDLAGREPTLAQGRQEQIRSRHVRVVDFDFLQPQARRQRPFASQLPPQRDPSAGPVLVPVEVEPLVIETGDTQAEVGVQEIRIRPVEQVATEVVTGHRLDPKPLAAAPERRAVGDVLEACRQTQQIEVVFVKHDRANHARIAVHPGSKHQPAGPGLGHIHVDVEQPEVGIDKRPPQRPEGITQRRVLQDGVVRLRGRIGLPVLPSHHGGFVWLPSGQHIGEKSMRGLNQAARRPGKS